MKKIILLLMLALTSSLYSVGEVNIEMIEFKGCRLEQAGLDNGSGEIRFKLNIAYSPILPAGAIYSLMDTVTGLEALVQIGFAPVDNGPFSIYLPESTFNFFSNGYDSPADDFNLKVKFLAWNREDSSSEYLNIKNLVIDPDRSIERLRENNPNNSYIQIGSFRHYQNAFPLITELMPYLEVRPNFYLIPHEIYVDNVKQTIYRIFAGPYDTALANRLKQEINAINNRTVFIRTGDNILIENSGERGGSR